MMLNRKNARCRAFLVLLVLTLSMLSGVLAVPPDADFPLVVDVDGTTPKTYIFATHTGSEDSGNWIELSGGIDITLPQISVRYDGISDTAYTKDGDVAIDTDTSFIGDAVIYPYTTHPLFKVGDTVTYTLYGPTSYAGLDVEFRAIRVDDPLDYENAITDLYNGDNDAFEDLIDTSSASVTSLLTTTFDANGDCTDDTIAAAVGDYILLALYENVVEDETTLYSATLVEILDGALASTLPDDTIREGNDLDIEMTLTGGGSTANVFGAVMIKESAYRATALMTSSGSISTTEVTVNGATVVEGGADSFSLFAGGFDGFDQDALMDFMGEAFDSDEWTAAFSTSTAATTYTLSIDTAGLAEDDYVVLTGVWDHSADISTGNRLLGFDQDTIFVDKVVFMPPAGSGTTTTTEPPTQSEFDDQTSDEQVDTISELDTEDAVDLLEGASTDDATQVLETLDDDKATELIEAMDETKVTEIMNTMQTETASKLLNKTTPQKAAQILTGMDATKAGAVADALQTLPIIVEDAVTVDKTQQIAAVLNKASKEKVGDALLAVQPDTGAKVIREMATQDLNGAAERVEAAVKKQINSLDPAQKETYRQKLKATMENEELSVDDLVNLFTEIANLPETPSTVAEIFEIIDLSKTVEVVDGMIVKDKEQEVALVFSYLSTDKLTEVYSALSAATRTVLYPFFDAETLGNLPQLGEFTVSSLSVSDDTVEPGTAVTVTAVIENIGDETDSTTITVSVDGSAYDSEIVTLDAGASTTLTWTITKTTEGTYTVDVMGETVSFTVEAPPEPAEFTLSNLQVSPSTVEPGNDVTVSFTVMNTGEETGDYSVEVKLDGATVDTLTGTLDGGASDSLTATVSSDADGTHTVSVDGLDADFSVELPPSGFPWTYIIVAVVIIAAAAYIYLQQQKQ